MKHKKLQDVQRSPTGRVTLRLEQLRCIEELYKWRKSAREVAKFFNIKKSTVEKLYMILSRGNCPRKPETSIAEILSKEQIYSKFPDLFIDTPGKRFNIVQKTIVLELYRHGVSVNRISKHFNISRHRVNYYFSRFRREGIMQDMVLSIKQILKQESLVSASEIGY